LTIPEIFNAIKSYLAGFLTFVVCFSVAGVFLWDEYKEVQVSKENVSTKLLLLKDTELKLEKDKSLLQLKLKEQEFALSKKEIQMDKAKKDLEERIEKLKSSLSTSEVINSDSIKNKEKELNILIEQYESNLDEVKELYTLYSLKARKAKAEDLILKTMEDFSALGVNISRPDWCDKDYMKRYYQGEALIDRINALNSEYSISEEYEWFVKSHSRSMRTSSDGECKANKPLKQDS
jgi:hypothetical protein